MHEIAQLVGSLGASGDKRINPISSGTVLRCSSKCIDPNEARLG